uniref:DUF2971 domain-containing protein n=1 Tax=Chryseobacterium sp. B5 TaxID=2050562 RepID=A0A2G7SP99_9FLAO
MKKTLYKYRQFDELSISALISDKVFLSSPEKFNDPLECKPEIEMDIEIGELKFAVASMIEKRVLPRLNSAAKSLKINHPDLENKIKKLAKIEGSLVLDRIDYNSNDPDLHGRARDYIEWALLSDMEKELRRQYKKGILSLSENPNCHLMWSHYAKNHTGFCIGYDVDLEKK